MRTIRVLLAFAAVFLTYNTMGFDLYHLVQTQGFTPLVAISGATLLICWAIVLRATFRSLGYIGIALVLLLLGALVWLISDVVEVGPIAVTLSQVGMFILLVIGISWSVIRRKLTGQLDTDDVGTIKL